MVRLAEAISRMITLESVKVSTWLQGLLHDETCSPGRNQDGQQTLLTASNRAV